MILFYWSPCEFNVAKNVIKSNTRFLASEQVGRKPKTGLV